MGIFKKMQRWFRDPRRSPRRRPVNKRSPIPLITTQTVTSSSSIAHEQRPPEQTISERDDIARRMKEMVNRSVELRNAKNVRSPQRLNVYQERVDTRLGRGPNTRTRGH
jgi:hypothetical protein